MIPRLSILLAAAALSLALSSPSRGQSPATPEADELVGYANLLGTRGSVSKIGDRGLSIEGSTISGEATRSPQNALARAAELYAEAAISAKDPRTMSKAFAIWNRIRIPEAAIPYLRLSSKNAETSRDSFALFCLMNLAGFYEKAEDVDSAAAVYSRCAKIESPKSDMEVEAVALAAQFALGHGDLKQANELATRALAGTDPNKFTSAEGSAGPDIARAVLGQIPGADLPGNPSEKRPDARRLLIEATVAVKAKNYPQAIEYWLEYKRQFPNEDASRKAVLQAAGLYETLKQPDKAIELYSTIEAQYANFSESWQATLRKAQIIQSLQGREPAIRHLQGQVANAKTAEAASQLTLALANTFLEDRRSDEAAEMYIRLLSQYGNQDAAKGVLPQLQRLSPQIKDWKKFSTAIATWLTQERASPARSAQKILPAADASSLRRLVLTYYAKSNNPRSGIKWLREVTAGDTIDAGHADRDQAWFLAQNATYLAQRNAALTTREREEAVTACVSGWKLASQSPEGFACLQAAHSLAVNPYNTSTKKDRDLEKELQSLLSTDRKDQGFEMLAAYYEFLGDKSALARLKEQNLQSK